MTEFRLGRSIAIVVPFIKNTRRQQDEPIFSNKIIAIFAIVAVIKVSILLAWR